MGKLRVDWLPLAYVGRHEPRWESESDAPAEKDEDGKLAAAWREAYDEAGGNTGAVVQHLEEVVPLLASWVEGASWPLRRAAAYSLLELSALPSSVLTGREAAVEEMGRLAGMLVDRKWRGKEAALPKLRAAYPKTCALRAAPASPAAEEATEAVEEPKAEEPASADM